MSPQSRSAAGVLLGWLFGAPLAAGGERTGPWQVPPEGRCTSQTAAGARDATAFPFAPGDTIGPEAAEGLREFLPPEIWARRQQLFWDGMQLEIGPCHRDYSAPEFYRSATERFAGRAKLTPAGGLEGHTAGLPFPPETIADDDPEAGRKWAWNFVQRYRGAGAFVPSFRASHLSGRATPPILYLGEMFQAVLVGRADRPEDDYRQPGARDWSWVAGGSFEAPQDARGVAWRVYRDADAQRSSPKPDQAFRYAPGLRRVRRVPTVPYQSHIPFAGDPVRPNAFDWRVQGVRDMLAPINVAKPFFPANREPDYGPWGLSFADDRWDLRRVLILEGTVSPEVAAPVRKVTLYLDLQTLQPLYHVAEGRDGSVFPSYFIGRWSEDQADYPRWPDDPDRPVRTLDMVGGVTFTEDGGCRIEAWSTVSTPPSDKELKRRLPVSALERRGR